MSDSMNPIPFERLIQKYLIEYKMWKTIEGVPVYCNEKDVPIGPAAGPHTQLAQNIVTSYAAGAEFIELKTVQVLEGSELGIKKPCICVKDQVYNTEWSTELSIKQAAAEYIKAYLVLFLLAKEFHWKELRFIHFICSVGYDLKGIQSEKVDHFLETMKCAKESEEWKKDIQWILSHLELFDHVTKDDCLQLSSQICDTVTLSTMHGCKAEEIASIAKYLLKEKKLNTFIKMNPTILGKEMVRKILDEKGYQNIIFDEEIFTHDLTLEQAMDLIKDCKETAEKCQLKFGVKMTNTFPVRIQNGELAGDTMYLSGKALYPLAINAAKAISQCGEIGISYSGGADSNNIAQIIATGIAPVTVSSILLKPGGYKNITKLIKKCENSEVLMEDKVIHVERLSRLAKEAITDTNYDAKKEIRFAVKNEYDPYCSKCHNCEDVCPNRANIRLVKKDEEVVVHLHNLCNECGCCMTQCIMGHIPYLEKFSLTEESNKELFELAKEQGKI